MMTHSHTHRLHIKTLKPFNQDSPLIYSNCQKGTLNILMITLSHTHTETTHKNFKTFQSRLISNLFRLSEGYLKYFNDNAFAHTQRLYIKNFKTFQSRLISNLFRLSEGYLKCFNDNVLTHRESLHTKSLKCHS